MTRRFVRLTAAGAIAVGIALPFMVSEIAGIATWKIILALAGLVLFIGGGRIGDNARRSDGAN